MRDRRRWLGGPLGRELPGPAVGAGAQGVVIQEGLHSHPTGSDSGWVRRATRVETNSYQATKLPSEPTCTAIRHLSSCSAEPGQQPALPRAVRPSDKADQDVPSPKEGRVLRLPSGA